jgi:hypothetical protein
METQYDHPFASTSGLIELAHQNRDVYRAAKPWPHLVIEGLFQPTYLTDAESQELPLGLTLDLQSSRRIVKAESPRVRGPAASAILRGLGSDVFVSFLEVLTGVTDLLTDPELTLAGLHVSPPGAFQRVHRDFRKHPTTGLYHRLNVIVFLNSDWKRDYGGELELWRSDMSSCGERILPTAGKVVIFETTPVTFHGVEPVRCPAGSARLSLATYYYTESPGRDDRKEPRYMRPKRPQDPWHMRFGGLADSPRNPRRIYRKIVDRHRAAN